MDLPDSADYWDDVRAALAEKGVSSEDCFAVSAATGQGAQPLVRRLHALLDALPLEVGADTESTSTGDLRCLLLALQTASLMQCEANNAMLMELPSRWSLKSPKQPPLESSCLAADCSWCDLERRGSQPPAVIACKQQSCFGEAQLAAMR